MIYKMYSVYDRVAGVYMNFQLFINDESAIRAFSSSDSFRAFLKDYDLYQVAVFDIQSGEFKDIEKRFVCHFSDFGGSVNE